MMRALLTRGALHPPLLLLPWWWWLIFQRIGGGGCVGGLVRAAVPPPSEGVGMCFFARAVSGSCRRERPLHRVVVAAVPSVHRPSAATHALLRRNDTAPAPPMLRLYEHARFFAVPA